MGCAFFIVEKDTGILDQIDYLMIEPMHNAGYTIVKLLLDGKLTEAGRVEPDEDIPEGFIEKSRHGFVIYDLDGLRKSMQEQKRRESYHGCY